MPVAASRISVVNSFVRTRFVHLISVIAIAGFFMPDFTAALRTHKAFNLDASNLALFLMMLSAAIQCSFGAFRKVVTRPRALFTMLGLYFVALPAMCWLLGQLCVPLLGRELGEPLQIGLDLVVLMPVAATAAIWVRDAKGDIELLVSLVIITMSVGSLTAPVYLSYMNGLTENTVHIPTGVMLHQLAIGVLAPLALGMVLNKVLRSRLPKVQPWFSLMGSVGLFMAIYLNVGTASPMLHRLTVMQVVFAIAIVLSVNLANFTLGSFFGRVAHLNHGQQITTEFASGMRSNGTALVVGLASFPTMPMVTVPAAIYIIFQHLVAGVVKARQMARYGDVERKLAAAPAVTATQTLIETPLPEPLPAAEVSEAGPTPQMHAAALTMSRDGG